VSNLLPWFAGALVLYLATRPRGVEGSPDLGGRTGSIDGHTTDLRTPPDLEPGGTCAGGMYWWEGECVRWNALPTFRQQELMLAQMPIAAQ
jgi:hypothetical protein